MDTRLGVISDCGLHGHVGEVGRERDAVGQQDRTGHTTKDSSADDEDGVWRCALGHGGRWMHHVGAQKMEEERE